MLVHALFSTDLLPVITRALQTRRTVHLGSTNCTVEVGYAAHFTRLGRLILAVSEKNEDARSGIEAEFTQWESFCAEVLKPRLEARKGELS